jgi:hypothetical protein
MSGGEENAPVVPKKITLVGGIICFLIGRAAENGAPGMFVLS